ncbi:MAG: hypothetical protein JW709_01270 [Sedimentisphaerales bacterium]|nr:hypothetical protein [Sedimentisphaerales bacterium]
MNYHTASFVRGFVKNLNRGRLSYILLRSGPWTTMEGSVARRDAMRASKAASSSAGSRLVAMKVGMLCVSRV